MNLFTLLVIAITGGAIVLVIRAMIGISRRNRQSSTNPFPVFSLTILFISLMLLIIGTFISLQVSDALGGAISGIGGFLGMYESHVRHKREADNDAA